MRKRTTLAQVASVAGVSKTTASYVFNGQHKVSAETRKRVLAAADRLGYRLNASARSLRRERAEVLGVLMVDSAAELVNKHQSIFWPRFSHAFVQACSERGFVVSFTAQSKVQQLIDSGIDMLLILGVHPAEAIDGLDIPYGLPVIAMTPLAGVRTTVVGHNPDAIAAAVVDHLRHEGATHVGWLAVDEARATLGHWPGSLAQACSEHGLDFSHRWIDDRLAKLDHAVEELVEAGVDGLYAFPGSVPKLIDALQARGKSVPDDILVITQGEGLVEQFLTPTVSNLSLCAADSAVDVAQVAADWMDGRYVDAAELPFSLNIRQSSSRGSA